MSVFFYSESELELYDDRSEAAGEDDHSKNPLNIVCIANGPVQGNAYIVWEANHPDQGNALCSLCERSHCDRPRRRGGKSV